MMAPSGSFAEYAVSWAHTTFHIPNNVSFEGVFFPTAIWARGNPKLEVTLVAL